MFGHLVANIPPLPLCNYVPLRSHATHFCSGNATWRLPFLVSVKAVLLLFHVKAPPMVGPTWTRVRFILGSDCLPALFQGTICLSLSLYASFVVCVRMFNVWCLWSWGCTSTSYLSHDYVCGCLLTQYPVSHDGLCTILGRTIVLAT